MVSVTLYCILPTPYICPFKVTVKFFFFFLILCSLLSLTLWSRVPECDVLTQRGGDLADWYAPYFDLWGAGVAIRRQLWSAGPVDEEGVWGPWWSHCWRSGGTKTLDLTLFSLRLEFKDVKRILVQGPQTAWLDVNYARPFALTLCFHAN